MPANPDKIARMSHKDVMKAATKELVMEDYNAAIEAVKQKLRQIRGTKRKKKRLKLEAQLQELLTTPIEGASQ